MYCTDHRTAKLPHGFRIEIFTYTAPGQRYAVCHAIVYNGSDIRSQHQRSWDHLENVGQLIDHRNAWIDTITPEV